MPFSSPIEIVNQDYPRGPIHAAIFDFDGTLSLLRRNWQAVMIPMMVEVLRETNTDESEEELDDLPQGDDPAIIAEMTTEIETMSVSEAVMRLDLSGQPALLFRNASHNGLNMVYRRADGSIGWVEPH